MKIHSILDWIIMVLLVVVLICEISNIVLRTQVLALETETTPTKPDWFEVGGMGTTKHYLAHIQLDSETMVQVGVEGVFIDLDILQKYLDEVGAENLEGMEMVIRRKESSLTKP